MTILGAGSEMSAFAPSDGGVTEATDTGSWNTSNGRCSIKLGVVGSTTGYIETPVLGSQTTLWFRMCHWAASAPFFPTDYTLITWVNASGTEVAKVTIGTVLYGTSDLYCKFWHLASGVMTQVGSTFTFATNQINSIIVKIVAGAAPTFEIYVADTLRASGTGAGSSLNNMDKVRVYNAYQPTHVSELIWSTTSLIGFSVLTDAPTGNSATNTAWVGDYTAVDELVYSDADSISSAVNNDVETFTTTHSLTGLSVAAIVVAARAKRSATGPQNIRLAIRSGGTNYFSGADKALTDGYAPYITVWETDPATSAVWASVPEYGVKSLA